MLSNIARCLLALALALATSARAQTTHDVPGQFPTIQAAIDAALSGDSVRVAPGTYVETLDYRSLSLRVFSSGGPLVTTIDGAQAGSVVTVSGTGTGPGTSLEGFTITGGRAVMLSGRPTGGGVYCFESTLELHACILVDNVGSSGGGAGGAHVAMGSLHLERCTFRANQGGPTGFRWGAGGVNASQATLTLDECDFIANVGGDSLPSSDYTWGGPGGLAARSSTLEVFRCRFDDNLGGRGRSSGYGGAGAITSETFSLIDQCEFRGNRGGDGERLGGAGALYMNRPRVRDCLFVGNVGGDGEGAGGAGAMRLAHAGTIAQRCTLEFNQGGRSGTQGQGQGGAGAVAMQNGAVQMIDSSLRFNRGGRAGESGAPGGLLISGDARAIVDRVLFEGNVGGRSDSPDFAAGAGAVFARDDDRRSFLLSCVFRANRGADAIFPQQRPGIGAVQARTRCEVTHGTVVENIAGVSLGSPAVAGIEDGIVRNSIVFANRGGAQLRERAGLSASHSLVQGGWPGVGNLDADPRFVDAAAGDHHLACNSPARDAGLPFSTNDGYPMLDIDRSLRVFGVRPDLGAFEYSLSGSGVRFCVSNANSSGFAAVIDAFGCDSIGVGSLPLRAEPVPANTTGLFFFGDVQVQTPFGNGFRCVGGLVWRTSVSMAQGNVLLGDLDYSSTAGSVITVGSTWFFQARFRDVQAGAALFDTSDGIGVTFQP